MSENIPLWKQGLQERVGEFAQPASTETPSSNELEDEELIRQSVNDLTASFLAEKALPSNTLHDKQAPHEQRALSVTEDPGIMRKLAFGTAQGKEDLTVTKNLNDYMITNHPELALSMGLFRREKGREAWENIAEGKGEEPEEVPWLAKVIGDVVRTGVVGTGDWVVRTFGSEQDVAQWEEKMMEKQFGENWTDMDPEQRRAVIDRDTNSMLAKNFPDVYGTVHEDSKTAMVGNLLGAMADPTTVLPVGQSYKTAAVVGGSIGASDAALYDLAKEGVIDSTHVAIGATLGTVLGPAISYTGGKLGGFISGKASLRTANKILKRYENSVLYARKRGVSKDFAHNAARFELGLSTDSVNTLYKKTGRTFNEPVTPAAAREALEMRASWLQKNRMLNKITKTVDPFIRPVSTRMQRLSPKIAQQMRVHDAAIHISTHEKFAKVEPFFKKAKQLPTHDQAIIKKALINGDNAELTKLIRSYENKTPEKFKGFMKDLKQMRKTLRGTHKAYKQMGYNMEYVKGYFPRVWRDPSKMGDVQKGLFNQMIISKRKELGRALSSDEISDVIRGAIHKPTISKVKAKTSGSLRSREIEHVPDELLGFYAEPLESIHSYIRASTNDIERARFFKHFGHKGGMLTDGTDMDSHLHNAVNKERKRLGLSDEETNDIVTMLRARFNEGEISPHRNIQALKNIGYSATLGNPLSALTQLGDQAFSIYKSGFLPTVLEAARGLRGKRIIRKTDLGLSDAVEELFADSSVTKKTLNKFLKWSGFNKMDQFGKETIMNASLKQYQKMMRSQKGQSEFAAKWGEWFENDTVKLMSELKSGELTDNVKLLMWHDLADVQPISLSEMPERYLRHPNGRIFYMLKTFTVKAVDFMRREIIEQFTKGNYGKGTRNLTMLTGAWLLMNGSADGLKTVVTGEDFDVTDNMVENLIQMSGFSRYTGSKAFKEGPATAMADFFMPPTSYVDNVFIGLTKGDLPKAIEPIPIVGKIIYKAARAQDKKRGALQKRSGSSISPLRDKALK